MKLKTFLIGGLIVAAGVGAYMHLSGGAKGLTPQDFEMITLKRGPVIQQVTASGKIQPVNTVSVGTQVSGIIEQVLVDYNDEVQKDQLLAKLDTAVLQENKNDAKAQLDLARAKLKFAKQFETDLPSIKDIISAYIKIKTNIPLKLKFGYKKTIKRTIVKIPKPIKISL